MKLLKGEGWVELLYAAVGISVFGVWLFTVNTSRLNTPTLWEAWQAQHQPAPVERVAATQPESRTASTLAELAAK